MDERDLRERGEHANFEQLQRSSNGLQFTLGKEPFPVQQPLRSDGFHYTHQHWDQDFEDGLKNLMNPPISEGAFRESQVESKSLTNLKQDLNDSKGIPTANYALRTRHRF